jgi:hypothetical protein
MASIVAHPVLVTHLRHLAAFWRELAVRDWETGADDADEAAYRRGVDACFVTCAPTWLWHRLLKPPSSASKKPQRPSIAITAK